MLEGTDIWVCLVIILIVDTFKYMRVQFSLFGFKTRRVHLKVCLVTLGKIIMVFNLVWSVTLNAPKVLEATSEGDISLLPAVLTLWDSRIHIHISNGSNITTNIEALIDEFGWRTTLYILNVNPNNSHVWFWKDFDNSRFQSNFDVIKNMSGFNNWSNHF